MCLTQTVVVCKQQPCRRTVLNSFLCLYAKCVSPSSEEGGHSKSVTHNKANVIRQPFTEFTVEWLVVRSCLPLEGRGGGTLGWI